MQEGSWFFSDNIYDAANDADAIVVLTEWEEYSNINWDKISKLMRKPSWIFDSRSILNGKEMKLTLHEKNNEKEIETESAAGAAALAAASCKLQWR